MLRTGGTIAFSTWPPELFVGRLFGLVARYQPPPQASRHRRRGADPTVGRERLGGAVSGIRFDRDTMIVPSLSPQHHREMSERTAGPMMKLVETLRITDPQALDAFRREYESLLMEYFAENTIRQGYLMTGATKM